MTTTPKHEPHRFLSLKRIPWPYCRGCGLLRLKNQITDWAVRHGCNYDEHPGWKQAMRSLTRTQ